MIPGNAWARILPHVLLWGLALVAFGVLALVLWPVASALLLAAAVVAVTGPVVHRPLAAITDRLLPRLDLDARRWLSALAATVLLATTAAGAALVVLWALLGSLGGTVEAVIGVALQDEARITATAELAGRQAADLARLYGGGVVSGEAVRRVVHDLMTHTRVGAEVLQFLGSGTGGFVARAALVLVTLFYLFCQGPGLVGLAVRWLPLDETSLERLRHAYHTTAYHLLAHILGRALALGMGLGLIAWTIAGLNGVLVAIAAAVLGLLPLVGPLVAWMPLAGLVWGRGEPVTAVLLAMAGWAWCWLVGWLFRRVAARLGTDQVWLEFLVFLGLVGGILAHGAAGVVFGPAAVLAAAVAGTAIRSVYRPEDDAITTAPAEPPRAGNPPSPGPSAPASADG